MVTIGKVKFKRKNGGFRNEKRKTISNDFKS